MAKRTGLKKIVWEFRTDFTMGDGTHLRKLTIILTGPAVLTFESERCDYGQQNYIPDTISIKFKLGNMVYFNHINRYNNSKETILEFDTSSLSVNSIHFLGPAKEVVPTRRTHKAKPPKKYSINADLKRWLKL